MSIVWRAIALIPFLVGYMSFDDLLVTEPSMDDLAVIGISIPGDREKIFYEINPEAALLDAGLMSPRSAANAMASKRNMGAFFL